MVTVARLKRLLLALSEPALRIGWLEEQLELWSVSEAATLLHGLCEESERSDPEAREALLSVVMLLAQRGDDALVQALREEAAGRRLLSLDRLVRAGPAPVVVERPATELPVPDYGVGRELTLGERRSLARRPNRRAFDRLLSDPHPLVIRQLLQNPKLTEADVLRLVTRRPARLEVLREVVQYPRWLTRSRVRLSILLNPGSPPAIAIPMLSVCKRTELVEVLRGTDVSNVLRATALELLERRPPLAVVDQADAVLQ
ncbi:MAG: hypothetical protein KC776_09360 [Myxococcales bacterium]|nr:hypothetical protein [Myxococcales bacterium]MCB9581728.1 hypothetical protein [Polyangiaceae bacterium]